jgi:succinoglycan biosynthesis protein ExoO
MPTFNAAGYVATAVRSALVQTLAAIEVVVVDDCSTDATMTKLKELQAADPRVRVNRMARNSGPGAARNLALALARGRFAAILDSDDLMAPDRLEKLVAVAERENADIVADNLVSFDSGCPASASFFLDPLAVAGWISAEHYLARTVIYESPANLGYLKPMFRLTSLRASGVGYDEKLRIAEDDNLIVRLLLAGHRYWLEPSPGYAYRRHVGSTSHRLTLANCSTMVAANAALAAAVDPALQASFHRALAKRQRALVAALGFERLIAAIKAGQPMQAVLAAASCPACLPLLHMPIAARFARLGGRRDSAKSADPEAVAALARITGVAA